MSQTKVTLDSSPLPKKQQKNLLEKLCKSTQLLNSDIRNKILSPETSPDELNKIDQVLQQIQIISKN